MGRAAGETTGRAAPIALLASLGVAGVIHTVINIQLKGASPAG
jgi:hypothetical protein